MPFKSEQQRKWMYANKPEMAREWEAHTPKDKKLPKRVKKADSVLPQTNGETPPHLRPAGPGGASCQSCKHYQQDTCVKYSYPVSKDMVCDDFEAISVGTDKIVNPEPAMRATSSGPEEVGDSLQTPMDERSSFKFAFLYNCIDKGMTDEQIYEYAEKVAVDLGDIAKKVFDTSALLAVGAPIGIGMSTGFLHHNFDKMTRDPDPINTMRLKELTDEYTRLAEEAKNKKKLRQAAGKTGLIRLG